MPMRNRERFQKFGEWVRENCCKGREMKTPVTGGRDYDVKWAEPQCFVGNLYPLMSARADAASVTPSILVMCGGGDGAGETSEYLDSRQHINRPDEVGETLEFQLVHAIYEPGTRTGKMTGERETPHESMEWNDLCDEGSMVLVDWMDDTKAALLGADSIPGTDLIIRRKSVRWEPLKENGAVADRRPFYMGVVAVTCETQTREDNNRTIQALLD